jgi:hypothetical protein
LSKNFFTPYVAAIPKKRIAHQPSAMISDVEYRREVGTSPNAPTINRPPATKSSATKVSKAIRQREL